MLARAQGHTECAQALEVRNQYAASILGWCFFCLFLLHVCLIRLIAPSPLYVCVFVCFCLCLVFPSDSRQDAHD
jgi:hypothetical protein